MQKKTESYKLEEKAWKNSILTIWLIKFIFGSFRACPSNAATQHQLICKTTKKNSKNLTRQRELPSFFVHFELFCVDVKPKVILLLLHNSEMVTRPPMKSGPESSSHLLFMHIWILKKKVKSSYFVLKSHHSKSQIFVQKFNSDKTLQFSREIKVVNN